MRYFITVNPYSCILVDDLIFLCRCYPEVYVCTAIPNKKNEKKKRRCTDTHNASN